jgi:hypothetical protein
MAGFEYDRIGPLEDAIGELSGWYAFSDAAQQDQARQTSSPGAWPFGLCRPASAGC